MTPPREPVGPGGRRGPGPRSATATAPRSWSAEAGGRVVVTVGTWELEIPGARSLKEKRSVLRSLKDRLSALNVSVVESGLQESRDRTRVSVAFLAAHNAQADSVLEAVDGRIADSRGARVVGRSTDRC